MTNQSFFKIYSSAILAFGLIFIQLSFLLSGVIFLDALGCSLILLSFLIFFFNLLNNFRKKSIDYRISFILLLIGLTISFAHKFNIAIASVDDNYHLSKALAYTFENSRYYILNHIYPMTQDSRMFHIDFIESLWGIFWRWTHIDQTIIFLQGLILIVLWHQLLKFFEFCSIKKSPALLSLIVILNMQIYWTQIGSGYIDGTGGVFAAITLLGAYRLLKGGSTQDVSFSDILSLSIASILCALSKLPLSPICLLGLLIVLLNIKKIDSIPQRSIIVLFVLIGASYIIYHYSFVWLIKGHPLYPAYPAAISASGSEGWYHYLYNNHKAHDLLKQYNLSWRPNHVMVSWLFDYKYRTWLTADPWIGGNGILWTYCFVPTFFAVLFQQLLKILKPKELISNLLKPENIIIALIVCYWIFLDISLNNRFMLGINTFLLALSLQWAYKKFNKHFSFFQKHHYKVLTVVFLLAIGSYVCAVDEDMIPDKHDSLIKARYELFEKKFGKK